MRKLRNVAVLVAALGSIGLVGGTAHADQGWGKGGDGDEFNISQHNNCKSHDTNLNVLGGIDVLGGTLSGLLGNEGNPGAESNHLGSTMDCSNHAFG